MNLFEVAKKWLEDNGFNGLCLPDECGCSVDNFMLCGEPSPHCEAVHLEEAYSTLDTTIIRRQKGHLIDQIFGIYLR